MTIQILSRVISVVMKFISLNKHRLSWSGTNILYRAILWGWILQVEIRMQICLSCKQMLKKKINNNTKQKWQSIDETRTLLLLKQRKQGQVSQMWISTKNSEFINSVNLCKHKPSGSSAVHNVTSGHSDSWHRPCRVPFPSQTRWATCDLQSNAPALFGELHGLIKSGRVDFQHLL